MGTHFSWTWLLRSVWPSDRVSDISPPPLKCSSCYNPTTSGNPANIHFKCVFLALHARSCDLLGSKWKADSLLFVLRKVKSTLSCTSQLNVAKSLQNSWGTISALYARHVAACLQPYFTLKLNTGAYRLQASQNTVHRLLTFCLQLMIMLLCIWIIVKEETVMSTYWTVKNKIDSQNIFTLCLDAAVFQSAWIFFCKNKEWFKNQIT